MSPERKRVVIPRRLVGPTGITQGGYVGGLLARELGPGVTAEVRLRRPTPLETELEIDAPADRERRLVHRGETVAECAAVELEFAVPALVGRATAAGASDLPEPLWSGFYGMPEADRCFGCGPRADGLSLHPGPVADGTAIACAVAFPPDLATSDGVVPLELVWAAVDCPSMWACWRLLDDAARTPLLNTGLVTGSLTVSIQLLPTVSESLYVQAWPIDRDGRKFVGGAVLVTESGEILATARQTAIALKPADG